MTLSKFNTVSIEWKLPTPHYGSTIKKLNFELQISIAIYWTFLQTSSNTSTPQGLYKRGRWERGREMRERERDERL